MNRVELMERAADEVRDIVLSYFRQPQIAIENKLSGGFDPVTEADKHAEVAIRALIEAHFPEDGIFGEEAAQKAGNSGYQWIIDPIDGTRAFIIGAPTWCVLIALEHHGEAVCAIVDQPFTGERFFANGDVAQWVRGDEVKALKTASTSKLSNAILASTFPEIGAEDERRAFAQVAQKTRLTRYGLDAYGYALLAHGLVDIVIEAGLKPYDIAAPKQLVTAAGGIVTNWRGGALDETGQVLAAANPELHSAALRVLNGI